MSLDRLIEFASNHYLTVTAFVLLVITLITHESRRGGRNVSSRELTAMVNRDEAVVLDIRQKKDFATGHIVDSIHIPYDKFKGRIGELEKHKEKTIVVVCNSGVNAGPVCADLKKAGFNTARLSGGIGSWRADNLPTVKSK